jgi:hypothetical protein
MTKLLFIDRSSSLTERKAERGPALIRDKARLYVVGSGQMDIDLRQVGDAELRRP